jgi:hypothetical protein
VGVFTLISTHLLPLPNDKTDTEAFGGEVKGASSPTHKGEQYGPLIGVLDAVA